MEGWFSVLENLSSINFEYCVKNKPQVTEKFSVTCGFNAYKLYLLPKEITAITGW